MSAPHTGLAAGKEGGSEPRGAAEGLRPFPCNRPGRPGANGKGTGGEIPFVLAVQAESAPDPGLVSEQHPLVGRPGHDRRPVVEGKHLRGVDGKCP
jgi:hypothetical protein